MYSSNGTGTVEHDAASALNGRESSVGTPEPPQTVVHMQPSKIHIQDWYLYALAGLVVVGFFGLTMLLIMGGADTSGEHKDIVFMLFGGLVTGFSMVLSYFFGSSAGSAQKTVELAKIATSSSVPHQNSVQRR